MAEIAGIPEIAIEVVTEEETENRGSRSSLVSASQRGWTRYMMLSDYLFSACVMMSLENVMRGVTL